MEARALKAQFIQETGLKTFCDCLQAKQACDAIVPVRVTCLPSLTAK